MPSAMASDQAGGLRASAGEGEAASDKARTTIRGGLSTTSCCS